MPTWTLVLLIVVSGVAQIFGTVTVAVNYYLGVSLGRSMRDELDSEEAEEDTSSPAYQLGLDSAVSANLALAQSRKAYRQRLRKVLSFLDPHWYLVAGLVSYVVGALVGTAAAIGALYPSH